jgi:hypothetical protein
LALSSIAFFAKLGYTEAGKQTEIPVTIDEDELPIVREMAANLNTDAGRRAPLTEAEGIWGFRLSGVRIDWRISESAGDRHIAEVGGSLS